MKTIQYKSVQGEETIYITNFFKNLFEDAQFHYTKKKKKIMKNKITR